MQKSNHAAAVAADVVAAADVVVVEKVLIRFQRDLKAFVVDNEPGQQGREGSRTAWQTWRRDCWQTPRVRSVLSEVLAWTTAAVAGIGDVEVEVAEVQTGCCSGESAGGIER